MNYTAPFSSEVWVRRLKSAALTFLLVTSAANAAPPAAGDQASNFTLRTLDNMPVELKSLTDAGPVVLVVLRGWPEYQCPVCTRQVQEYIANAAQFARKGARVLMVYPGPAAQLKAHAQEFLQDKQWPAEFIFVTDPDYAFILAYGLRWEAKKETAYPSTFILDRGGKVRFAHVSKSHGDRLGAARALVELK